MKVSTDAGGQQVLVGSTGRTLYTFDPDTKGGQSVCYAQCAQAWPPLTVTGKPVLGAGLDESLAGTITRKDGTKQVTATGGRCTSSPSTRRPATPTARALSRCGG